jgi:hypothetical protein
LSPSSFFLRALRADQRSGTADRGSLTPRAQFPKIDARGGFVEAGFEETGMLRDEHGNELTRRDFHRLTTAAFGGLLAGTIAGCSNNERPTQAKTSSDPPKANTPATGTTPAATTAVALHACRGLNECKGQGKDHKNACAGQGNCYTVTHECAEKNDCKYQGGCGGTNGFNDCKGKGGCGHFPIADQLTWKKAREHFEARMKEAGKKIGSAPAATA